MEWREYFVSELGVQGCAHLPPAAKKGKKIGGTYHTAVLVVLPKFITVIALGTVDYQVNGALYGQ